MHLAALLILAFMCSVYARNDLVFKKHRNGGWRGGRLNPLNDKKYSVRIPNPSYDSDYAQIVPLDPRPMASWDTQEQYSESDTGYSQREPNQEQFDNIEDQPSDFDDPPKVWAAPPYHKSLTDYDTALIDIRSHFTANAFNSDDENKNFKYIVLAVVVDGLSRIVAERGWAYYDNDYTRLAKSLTERAVGNPHRGADMISCVFHVASKSIELIRALINHPWVQYLCQAHPAACDTVILAQMKLRLPDEKLEKSATQLLKLGQAASTFLNSYSVAFDAISEQNVYIYIARAKETLRELVQRNAVVRKSLFPNGGPTAATCKAISQFQD